MIIEVPSPKKLSKEIITKKKLHSTIRIKLALSKGWSEAKFRVYQLLILIGREVQRDPGVLPVFSKGKKKIQFLRNRKKIKYYNPKRKGKQEH